MSKIFILGANNEQLGPFTSSEARQGLTAGKYRQDQMAYAEGLSQWTPLVDVLVHVDKTSPAPAPVSAPASTAAPTTFSTTSNTNSPLTLPTASYSPLQTSSVIGLTGGINPAPFPIRMAACFIDNILLWVVNVFLALIAIAIIAVIAPATFQNGNEDNGTPNPIVFIVYVLEGIINTIIVVLYFSILEGSSMQGTVGKMVLGLKVTDEYGNPLGFAQALGRGASRILSYMICCIGFLVPLANDKKQTLHDIIAKTLVLTRY